MDKKFSQFTIQTTLSGGEKFVGYLSTDNIQADANVLLNYIGANISSFIMIYSIESDWSTANPILPEGFFMISSDDMVNNPKFKISDGVSDWATLPYFKNQTLSNVLTKGNNTGGKNIRVNAGDKIIILDNASNDTTYIYDGGIDVYNSTLDPIPLFQVDRANDKAYYKGVELNLTKTLNQVLTAGNTTNGKDINVSNDDNIYLFDSFGDIVSISNRKEFTILNYLKNLNLFSVDRLSDIVKYKNVEIATINDLSNLVPLNGSGQIAQQYLPSFVDDVIEGYFSSGAFYEDLSHTILITPLTGKIYVDLTSGQKYKTYRYSGSAYIAIANGLIASTDDVPEGSSNLYFTISRVLSAIGYTPENVTNKSTDGTLASNSNSKYPSEQAVKTYVDNNVPSTVKLFNYYNFQ